MWKEINFRQNGSSVSDRRESPNIWDSCPILGILAGKVDGVMVYDDFIGLGGEDNEDYGGWARYIDTSNTIRQLAPDTTALATGSRGGVLRLVIDATADNDSPTIQWGTPNSAGQFMIGNTAGAAWKLWFECRVRKSSIADDVQANFMGLAQGGCAADNGILDDNAGDVVNSISAIGWRTVHVNSGTTGQNALLDFVYQDAAQTAPTAVGSGLTSWVASTWIKLGFVYDPAGPASQKIKLYVNNAEQSSYVSTTNIDASTFPENDALSPIFCAKGGTNTASSMDIDWVRCVQVYDQGY